MSGDKFNKRQRQDSNELRLRDVLENLSNAFQSEICRDDGPIARATLDLLNYATDPKSPHSEHARSGITFRLAAGTLAEQQERLQLGDPARRAIDDLRTETYTIFKRLTDHPNLTHELCTYLIRPALPEEERFATRELLDIYSILHGRDAQMKGSMLFAESLAILEKPLRVDSGEMRLDEIAALTKQPSFWIALLDNLTDGCIRGTNYEALAKCLRDNLAGLKEDSTVQARLASLASNTEPSSTRVHTLLFGDQLPIQPELDLDGPTIDSFDL